MAVKVTEEEALKHMKWLKELNASGYAGMKQGTGEIVDRREHPKAIPIHESRKFGVAKPKDLPDEGTKN
jgi:hypothetical protein